MCIDYPILYSFRRCPYAMRARLAILSSGKRVALREVVLRDKPAAMLAASPKGTVPVLVLPDGRVIAESFDIMLWALGETDPQGWLTPWHDERSETESLIAENDGPFKRNLDRYKYATRYEGADPLVHRAEGLAFLARLNDRLAVNPFLSGGKFTLTDAATAPFVRQFANTDREWFDATNLGHVQRWLSDFLMSEPFSVAMRKQPAWKEQDAASFFP